jgi:hypothetical protein
MLGLFMRRPKVPYVDAITAHPSWPDAVRRARGSSPQQLNDWYIALAANAIREREQWERHEHPEDALGDMLLTHVAMEAIRRENAIRLDHVKMRDSFQ